MSSPLPQPHNRINMISLMLSMRESKAQISMTTKPQALIWKPLFSIAKLSMSQPLSTYFLSLSQGVNIPLRIVQGYCYYVKRYRYSVWQLGQSLCKLFVEEIYQQQNTTVAENYTSKKLRIKKKSSNILSNILINQSIKNRSHKSNWMMIN